MKNQIQVKDLIDRIAKLARERMSAGNVVSFDEIKKLGKIKVPPTILLIEDDESVRKLIIRILEGKKYRVLAAGSAMELLSVLYDTAIDLIILDVGLPWIDGYEIARMMKEHKDLKSVPIVFISGHNGQEAMKKGFQVGAHDFITKPFDLEKITKTIDTLLELQDSI